MIYDVNIKDKFQHRISVDDTGKINDPDTREKLSKSFPDYRHHFVNRHFDEFLNHIKHEHRGKIAVDEIHPDNAGEPSESDAPKIDKSGLMIAFFIPEEIASKLHVDGGEEPEELHLTLAYSGPIAELPAGSFEAACRVVEEFGRANASLSGSTTGLGIFNGNPGSPSGGKDCLYASFSSPALAKFREALVSKLEEIGLGPKSVFGYTPHITLKYIDQDEESPVRRQPKHEITFAKISVASGPNRKDFPLSR